MDIWGILALVGTVVAGLATVFFAGAQNQKGRQAIKTLKRFKKNKKTYKKVEAKHEGFQRKGDLESARQSFLSS